MAITGQIVVPRIAPWCAIHLADERGKPVLQQVWHEDERQVERLRTAVEASRRSELAGGPRDRPGLAGHQHPPGGPRQADRLPHASVGPREDARCAASSTWSPSPSPAGRRWPSTTRGRTATSRPPAGPSRRACSRRPCRRPRASTSAWSTSPRGRDAAVGGDFYDLFPIGNGTWCFVIGDVCGTGAEAAAVTGLAGTRSRHWPRAGFPVAATLERLNDRDPGRGRARPGS